jgi:hypothetical protein
MKSNILHWLLFISFVTWIVIKSLTYNERYTAFNIEETQLKEKLSLYSNKLNNRNINSIKQKTFTKKDPSISGIIKHSLVSIQTLSYSKKESFLTIQLDQKDTHEGQ